MADELNASFNLTFDDGISPVILAAVADRLATITTKRPTVSVQSIGIAEEAINLGDAGSVGAFAIVNLDPTNFVDVKVATSGAIFARLRPDTDSDGKGGFCVCTTLGSGAQAPFAIADTAACRVLVFICPP